MKYIRTSVCRKYHVLHINNTFVIGGAYSLEDGLAPSGGEGWAPPRAYDYVCYYFCLTPWVTMCYAMFYVDRLHKIVAAQCACYADF